MPSKDILNDLLEYRDGELFWKKRVSNKCDIGSRAGSVDKATGYRRILVGGERVKEHRLVWIMHNGAIPKGFIIDHKDRNKINNAIGNLRLATFSQNGFNTGMHPHNASGCKGIYYRKDRDLWVAEISANKERVYLGCYKTAELAKKAYDKAALKFHGEFANFA